ncbi:hypothetical protein CJF30_00006255 [Rutstroemia sp. NJR-2017a BBW]|nr:hypothetical protein CJF30_00006255 [Rutstroemia sp. NJR-2017a BBW]
MPILRDPSSIFSDARNGVRFAHFLRPNKAENEDLDSETQEAYTSTVSYLGYIDRHIQEKAPPPKGSGSAGCVLCDAGESEEGLVDWGEW